MIPDQPGPVLMLRLFGRLDVRTVGGRDLTPPGRKLRALLACLALPPGAAWPREQLIDLFWSDRADVQARGSLREALVKLRRHLGEPSPLRATRDTVALDPAVIGVDAIEFVRLAKAGQLDRAADLYHGDLLDGVSLAGAGFADWLLVERARLHDQAVNVLSRLLASQSGEPAVLTAQRLLRLDPTREEVHRQLMRIHVANGDRAQALRQFQACRDILRRELDVAPALETTALYRQIKETSRSQEPGAEPPARSSVVAEDPAKAMLEPKPFIAVLPFTNLSGDPEQDYFSDGITEDVITELSRFRSPVVIARHSSFCYKNRAVDVRQAGRELGVRYILEGSLRRASDRVRIVAQLNDVATGARLWADRFEGEARSIFDLQDRVTAKVVGAIAPRLEMAEIERVRRKPTRSLDAYDCFLRGMAGLHRWSRAGNDEALTHFYRAIELDPDYAAAHGLAARTYVQRNAGGWVTDRRHELAEANRLARRAVELGHDDAVALCSAGFALADLIGELDDGDAFVEKAIGLNPNLAWAWLYSGWIKAATGDPDRAVERIARARDLSPSDPQDFSILTAMAFAHFIAGRYDGSLACALAAIRDRPNYFLAGAIATVSAGLAGQTAEAARALCRLRQLNPGFCLAHIDSIQMIRRPEAITRWRDGFRKAGLTA